jgi:hypothetical protein
LIEFSTEKINTTLCTATVRLATARSTKKYPSFGPSLLQDPKSYGRQVPQSYGIRGDMAQHMSNIVIIDGDFDPWKTGSLGG